MSDVVPGLVSTIIPVFNRSSLVREAIESVLQQTYRPIEIIVVDDGSTDETPHVLERLRVQNSSELIVERRPSNGPGPGPAREVGRRLARGEFIQYLDSDDLLLPAKLETQVRALRERPECGIAYGWTRFYQLGDAPRDVPIKWTGQEFETLFPALLVDRWWSTNTPLLRRSVCDKAGPWSDIRWGQDWAYEARLGAQGVKLAYCPQFVADVRMHPGDRQTTAADQYTYDRLREYQRLQQVLFDCAIEAGIPTGTREMLHFSRVVFMLARGFGALSAAREAEECFELARLAAGPRFGNDWEYLICSGAVRTLGWTTVGKVSRWFDRVRLGGKGKYSLNWSWAEESEK